MQIHMFTFIFWGNYISKNQFIKGENTLEKSLVLIKPDGIKRKLVGEIIKRYEYRGLMIENIKMIKPTTNMLKQHYIEHIDKPFFAELVDYMSSDFVVAIVLSGEHAIELVRKINGSTNYMQAELGSIRGDFANSITRNLVHGCDSPESFKREYDIWFG